MKISSTKNESQICHFCRKITGDDSTNLYPYELQVHIICLKNVIRRSISKLIDCPYDNCHKIEVSAWTVANNVFTTAEYVKISEKLVDNRQSLNLSPFSSIFNLCNICKENIVDKNQLFYFPKCGHIYHCSCINHLLLQSKTKEFRCPNINQICQNLMRINKSLIEYGLLTDLEFYHLSSDLKKNDFENNQILPCHLSNSKEEIDNSIDVEALRRSLAPRLSKANSSLFDIKSNTNIQPSMPIEDKSKDTYSSVYFTNMNGGDAFKGYKEILTRNFCVCTSLKLKNPIQLKCCGILHDKSCFRKQIMSQKSLYYRCQSCDETTYLDTHFIENGVLSNDDYTYLKNSGYQIENNFLCCFCHQEISKSNGYYKICSRSHKLHQKCLRTFRMNCVADKIDKIKCLDTNCDELISFEKYKEECIICHNRFFKDNKLLQPYLVASTKYSSDVIGHQNTYLLVCPGCNTNWCHLCRMIPYHVGQLCAEVKSSSKSLYIPSYFKVSAN